MADNEIRNPAKAYFKWKMPVITKSEDDWNFWNTEDKYNRTMFIGYNDTTTPHVASLFIIVDGKPMQAVGDDVIARIAGLETNTAQALADIQALIDRVNVQQGEISNLQQECQRILEDAESSVRAAQIWAEGTDAQVAEKGGEHSAKGWAQKANDIVASGLPSDATFDHITVTSSSKFGQDPDRANQPGLEIEGTGEIQAYRTVNMMNGATVSYDETVEMPWSDSSNKVPNTAWVQQAVMHGVIDPNTELTVKKISTSTGGAFLNASHTASNGDKHQAYLSVHNATSDTDSNYIQATVYSSADGVTSSLNISTLFTRLQTPEFFFDGGNKSAGTEVIRLGQASSQAYQTTRYLYCEYPGRFVNGLQVGFINDVDEDGVPFKVLRSDNTTIGKWMAAFGVTPTVPDITDAADSSDKVPNTKWVQAAIAAGGGGTGGAVTSVNGKTGEVVLAAADVGAAPADALAGYVTTDAMNTELAGKQDKLTAESDLAVNNLTAANITSPGTIKAANADSSKYAQIAGTGLTYSSTGADNYMHDITDYGLRLRNLTSGGSHKATLIAGLSGSNACLQSKDGFVFQRSPMAALDTRPTATYLTMAGDTINLVKNTICSASMPAYTDSSTTVPTTGWVQGAIDAKTANLQPKLTAGDGITISETNVISATGGTGGGAVSSVNGKTGEVVLNATDVGAITGAEADTKITTALEPYAKTAEVTAAISTAVAPLATTEALTTGLAGKQDKLTAESDLSVNNLTANSITSTNGLTSETGTVIAKKIQTVADTTYNADGSFTRVFLNDIVTKSGTYGYVTLKGDEIRVNDKNSGKALTYLSSTGIYDTTAKPAADTSNTRVGTTAWVQSAINAKTANLQPKLTAGTGIAISSENVISATVSSAVDSVNGKTGAVVLTGEDIKTTSHAESATIATTFDSFAQMIGTKQDAITAGTDLNVRSLKAHYTATTPEGENQQYTMDVTGNGLELTDATNNISLARLTPTELNVPSLVANGAPGVGTLLTCYGLAKIDSLSSVGDQWATGAFNWDINTTTDYNKFEVYNLYFTDDAETGQKVPNRSVLFSIGGSPDNHSTWIDFTANYLSFKGDANFGETGMNHNMNFNGPSVFNNEARFTHDVTLGHGETTVEGEGGTPTTTPASLVFVNGDLVATGNATFNKGLSASGTVHINNATFWREVGEGVIPAASYNYSTGAFDISYLTSNDSGTSANRVTIVSDSREANYGATFNLPVTVSDASFKRTSTLAADDNSTEVPTTAWVKSAIAASGSSVPDDITCKTLKVTNWDGELDSIEFAGNLKYSGDYGNGSLGKITAREFYANSSGYYSTLVRTSGITLTSGSSGTTWLNADSSTKKLTITGDTTVTGTSTVHILNVGDGTDGQKFNCNADASFGYNVNIGWTSGRLKCMRDEYNWLFDFNRNASPGSMLKFNDTVTILSAMPASTDSSTKVPTTAWVQGAITAKAATKPTLTYAEKSGEPTVTKIEQCNGGSLCTVMWTGNVSTATGHVYIDLPTEFTSAKIVSTQFTAHDTGTAAPWTADASISGGKIMLSVKSTAASSSASATIVLYKA